MKRICDLKVKLAKLREEEEFEDALKDQNEDGCKGDPSGRKLFIFVYHFFSLIFIIFQKLRLFCFSSAHTRL